MADLSFIEHLEENDFKSGVELIINKEHMGEIISQLF